MKESLLDKGSKALSQIVLSNKELASYVSACHESKLSAKDVLEVLEKLYVYDSEQEYDFIETYAYWED